MRLLPRPNTTRGGDDGMKIEIEIPDELVQRCKERGVNIELLKEGFPQVIEMACSLQTMMKTGIIKSEEDAMQTMFSAGRDLGKQLREKDEETDNET